MTGHTTVRARVRRLLHLAGAQRQVVVVVGDRLREHDVGPLEQPVQQRHLVGGQLVHRRDAHARPRRAGRVLEQLPQRLRLAVAVHDEQGSVAVGQRLEPVEVPVVARPTGICGDRPDVAGGIVLGAGCASCRWTRSVRSRVTGAPTRPGPGALTRSRSPRPRPRPRPSQLTRFGRPRARVGMRGDRHRPEPGRVIGDPQPALGRPDGVQRSGTPARSVSVVRDLVNGRASMPLRIALIAPCDHPIAQPFAGGLESLVWQLRRALVARGHDVTLFAADGSDDGRRGARAARGRLGPVAHRRR